MPYSAYLRMSVLAAYVAKHIRQSRLSDEPSWAFRRRLIARKTYAERILWERLRDRKSHVTVLQQVPQGPYCVDFYIPHARLAVEIDGPSHDGRESYDAQRTFELRLRGVRVIRFSNDEVVADPQAVVVAIVAATKSPKTRRR